MKTVIKRSQQNPVSEEEAVAAHSFITICQYFRIEIETVHCDEDAPDVMTMRCANDLQKDFSFAAHHFFPQHAVDLEETS
jgi:hypothetical protein